MARERERKTYLLVQSPNDHMQSLSQSEARSQKPLPGLLQTIKAHDVGSFLADFADHKQNVDLNDFLALPGGGL